MTIQLHQRPVLFGRKQGRTRHHMRTWVDRDGYQLADVCRCPVDRDHFDRDSYLPDDEPDDEPDEPDGPDEEGSGR